MVVEVGMAKNFFPIRLLGRAALLTLVGALALSACWLGLEKSDRAEQALRDYFDYLVKGEYAAAAMLFGGDTRNLAVFNPQVDPNDTAGLLQLGCQGGGLHCLPVRILTFNEQSNKIEYIFTVQFSNPDGSLFVLPACCGETPSIPPRFEFEYRVIEASDGNFRVLDPPPTDPLLISGSDNPEQQGRVMWVFLPDYGSLAFPRQPAGDGARMEALVEGKLMRVEGCLRIGLADTPDESFLVLWPASVSLLVAPDGRIEVLDSDGRVVGRVGETIRLGGGAMEDPASVGFWHAQISYMPIMGCPGPYWVAGQTYPLDTLEVETPPADTAHLGTAWSDFSLRFDPLVWEITAFRADMPELQALTHQSLAGGCRITPNIPVGLGDAWTYLDGDAVFGQLTLHARRFYENGELGFVVYSGFLVFPMEGAVEVHFEENAEACLAAAEALFAGAEVILP